MGIKATAGRPASRRGKASATRRDGGTTTRRDGGTTTRRDGGTRTRAGGHSLAKTTRTRKASGKTPSQRRASTTTTPKRSRAAQKTTTRYTKAKPVPRANVKLVKRRTTPTKRKTHIEEPLDLTDGLIECAQDIVALIPELSHIRLDAVHFTIFHSRAAQRTLTYARCYPLPRGMQRRGRRWYQLTPVYTPQRKKAMYLLSFAWPRFWSMRPRARLETLVHELYHIGEAFDGEPRTFEVGGWHGYGRKWFDGVIRKLCEHYLPCGFELEYPVLNVGLEPNLRVTGERLRRPHWEEVFRSL